MDGDGHGFGGHTMSDSDNGMVRFDSEKLWQHFQTDEDGPLEFGGGSYIHKSD